MDMINRKFSYFWTLYEKLMCCQYLISGWITVKVGDVIFPAYFNIPIISFKLSQPIEVYSWNMQRSNHKKESGITTNSCININWVLHVLRRWGVAKKYYYRHKAVFVSFTSLIFVSSLLRKFSVKEWIIICFYY